MEKGGGGLIIGGFTQSENEETASGYPNRRIVDGVNIRGGETKRKRKFGESFPCGRKIRNVRKEMQDWGTGKAGFFRQGNLNRRSTRRGIAHSVELG